MNKRKALTLALVGATTLAAMGAVIGDDREHVRWPGARHDVMPVDHPAYATECGGCHFAYQPGLLPAATWERLMQGLAEHFGENAELGDTERDAITRYLVANAADRATHSRFAGIEKSLAAGGSLRITDSGYFRRKHDEVPARLVQQNPQVGSFSRCDACHAGAPQGNYDEHRVRIPGVGRWDD